MITKLKIKGYKSIKEQEVNLRSINILIGGNGVGKSNFISIFSLIRNLYESNLRGYVIKKGGANNFLYFGNKVTEQIELEIYFGDDKMDKNKFILSLGNSQNFLYIKSLSTAFNSGYSWTYRNYENNVEESNFKNTNVGQAYFVNDRLKEFDVYHFHDTSDNSPMKRICDINDNRILKRDGSNIASFLYYLKLKHEKHFFRIENTIKSIAPFFDKFVLEPNLLNENNIILEWKEKGFPDIVFNANNLSDGTLRFICLSTLLMQPNPPKTIIIDEPELGLHPVAINKIAGLIHKISDKVQLIISSQSVNFVDNFNSEDIIIADRIGEDTVFKNLNNEELSKWFEEYSLGEIWEKKIIGGQPHKN